MAVEIIEADLENPAHGQALIVLIDGYARGPGGQSAPLNPAAIERMVPGLNSHPARLILLARDGDSFVGAAVCFWLYSTFAGKPFLNVHDLTVHSDHRNAGIGTALLRECEVRARDRGCCKLTLEVHSTNEGARRLYERFGFGPWSDPSLYAAKPLT